MNYARGVYEQRPYDYDRGGYHNFGGRHSIDDVSGRPIYIEDFILPTFEGSTLIADFQFPFTLTNEDEITIVSANADLTTPTITRETENTVTIRWESSVIAGLTSSSIKKFRVRVANSNTGVVKVYNEITIKLY